MSFLFIPGTSTSITYCFSVSDISMLGANEFLRVATASLKNSSIISEKRLPKMSVSGRLYFISVIIGYLLVNFLLITFTLRYATDLPNDDFTQFHDTLNAVSAGFSQPKNYSDRLSANTRHSDLEDLQS